MWGLGVECRVSGWDAGVEKEDLSDSSSCQGRDDGYGIGKLDHVS